MISSLRNGEEKVKILLEQGLIKVAEPKAAPIAQNSTHEVVPVVEQEEKVEKKISRFVENSLEVQIKTSSFFFPRIFLFDLMVEEYQRCVET